MDQFTSTPTPRGIGQIGNALAASARPSQPPVSEALTVQQDLLAQLNSCLIDLSSRLSSVLGPDVPGNASEKTGEVHSIASLVRKHNSELDRMIFFVRNLNDRLEI